MRRSGKRRHRVLLDHTGSRGSWFPNRTPAPLPPPPSAIRNRYPSWSLGTSASCDAGGRDGDACLGKTLLWVTAATVIPAIFRRESSLPWPNFTGTRLIQSLRRPPGRTRVRPALATARFCNPPGRPGGLGKRSSCGNWTRLESRAGTKVAVLRVCNALGCGL